MGRCVFYVVFQPMTPMQVTRNRPQGMRHAADRKNRRLTLAGDNPLTDYTWSYGVFGPRFNRNISLSYGLGPSYACSTLTSRANFAISDESQHTKAWAVIHSEIPGDCIEIMLRYPADPDSRVAGTDPMPDCPDYPKGHTWGKVWTTPLLLTFDPSEKKPN
jgi:hypothetical protein